MVTQKFNPESILEKLNEIEAIFPVNAWQVNGLKIWPVLRTSLAYSQNQNPNTSKKKDTARSRRNRMKNYLKIVLKLPMEYLSLKKKLKKSNRLFFGASTHRVKLDGMFFNKFFDVAVGDFEQQHESSVIFDTSTKLDKKKYPHKDSVFSLPSFYILQELSRKLSPGKKKYTVELPGYDEFFDYALKTFQHTAPIKKTFNKRDVTKRGITLYERKEFAKRFLKDSGIKQAYFICYYSSLMYPMIAACNELGIGTADIQHGGLGRGHYCYDRWSKAPADGYALLPKYFWSWDANSAALVNEWGANTNFHRAFAVGNPWTDASIRLYKTPPANKDYLLVGMTEILLDEYLVETIQHFGASRKWVLRMHPRQYQHKAGLEKQLVERGIQDFAVVENPSEVPLPVSMRYCRGMLSKPSGSVIEAVEMGMKPVLLRAPNLMSYYAHYIEEEKVILPEEDTSECLIAILNDTSWQDGGQATRAGQHQEDKFHTFERSIAHTSPSRN